MGQKLVVEQYQINFSEMTSHTDVLRDTYEDAQNERQQQDFLTDGRLADMFIQDYLYGPNLPTFTVPFAPKPDRYNERRYPGYKLPPHLNAQR